MVVDLKKCPPTIKQYLELYKEYTKKFGEKTVVFMCVGSFYECYQVYELGNVDVLCDITGLSLTYKNTNKEESESNAKMAGFHESVIDKYVTKMINLGWTIIRVDQFDKEFSEEKERKVTKVYSASTYIENETKFNNYLVGIDYEYIGDKRFIHFVSIDLSTGNCKCTEMFDTIQNMDNSISEFERTMYSHNPSEILIREPQSDKDLELYKSLSMYFTKNISIHKIKINKEYQKNSYRQQFFNKVFSTENIGIEHYAELQIILISTIQFAYEHDNSLIERLTLPELASNNTILNLNNDAVYQLNLIGDNSIFDTIDFTSTNMGKRLLRDRLLYPITNIEELNNRYNIINELIECGSVYDIKKNLSLIADIEKKHRKAAIGKLNPKEFSQLQSSYCQIIKLFDNNIVKNIVNKYIVKKQTIEIVSEKFKNYVEWCDDTFDFTKMDLVTNRTTVNFFKNGVIDEIDELQTQIDEYKSKLQMIAQELTEYIGIVDCVKIVYADNEDYYFSTTVKRAEKLKKEGGKYQITNLKSVAKITTVESRKISSELKDLNSQIIKLVNLHYSQLLIEITQKYKNLLKLVVKIISIIDVSVCGSVCAMKFAYNKPSIIDNNDQKSYIKCKNIRHPIIERIISTEYIGNDIELNSNSGMLLYGLNSSGKSSLLRAVGANIVLAQAGLYVPSNDFTFYPYTELLCKISCTDNLFKSQSTFISELNELKHILTKSGKNTLVLGDELCNGTESYSASSLVSSAIMYLTETETTYAISTHLHEIVKFENIINNTKLKIKHFGVNISSDGKIEYTRKLMDGSGDALYGLEVASVVGLPSSFMKMAFSFRNSIENKSDEILSTKKSRYNSEIYMDKCNRCGSTTDLCTHHINEQQDSDKNGIIDGRFHKNMKFNLEVLCKKCHVKHHNDEH